MRVIFDIALCYYYKNFEIIKKKLEKFLTLDLDSRFYLVLMIILIQVKINTFIKQL